VVLMAKPSVQREVIPPGPPSESRLVSAAQGGDAEAFADLVAPHLDVVFRAAYLITGSAADAQDAAQEGLVKAWLALERFRTGAPFRPWLVRIVINEAHNRRRAVGRQAGLALRLAETAERAIQGSGAHARHGEAAAPGAEELALADERRARLLAAVAQLREDDQLVIAARYFVGLSVAETATALSLRVGTVKSRLSRALARLRDALGEAA
jgi:RNA polymerase sigma-70 factor (ECF subfamily)